MKECMMDWEYNMCRGNQKQTQFWWGNMYSHHQILKPWHRCENDIKNTAGKLINYNVHTQLKTFTASNRKK
jgi:hypothetical protein